MEQIKKIVDTYVRVRLVECDPYNIVHNSNYFVWFEMGRLDYARESGYIISDIIESDKIYMTLETKCKFLKAACFNDELVIKTRIDKLPILYAKYSFEQKLYNVKNGELLAVAHTQNVAIDRRRNVVLRLSEDEKFMSVDFTKG